MFESLERLPDDPVLGLAAIARADDRPQKVDLTVGIYQNEAGVCPVFGAIRQAQAELAEQETTKAYIAAAGDATFREGMARLVLGDDSAVIKDGRVSVIQAPGGCGALRIGAEIIHAANPGTKVWASDPTWPVHVPLVGSVGLSFENYRYYDAHSHGVSFEAMLEDLRHAKKGEVVLLHGCCHNPSGADLSIEQWQQIADLAEAQGVMPFIDIAYQGMGDGLEQDAAGLRLLAERLPEMIVAASCSKNMGLYRERTGATLFICENKDRADALLSQALVAARKIYSMPPAHGAILAGRILSDGNLKVSWTEELVGMRDRIQDLRGELVTKLSAACDKDFSFIAKEKGMFSFLGLTQAQVLALREQYGVYMLNSSRINVAGVNASNIDYLAQSVAAVMSAS
ncbi:MAG: aromatic amino acid aminotransferase [Gammaproteobacteria bacterium]|nr:MAG: aromatic amino acid aminotransferase [Gammaproteobacteria bacterium]